MALQKSRAQEHAAAPVAPAAATSAAKELTPEQRMGLTPGKIVKLQGSARAPELKELTAKIQAVVLNSAGREVFTLDNGQVWRQVEPDSSFTVPPGSTVRITRGALGSYFMSVGEHLSTRVSRER
jgi:hypothetical protein